MHSIHHVILHLLLRTYNPTNIPSFTSIQLQSTLLTTVNSNNSDDEQYITNISNFSDTIKKNGKTKATNSTNMLFILTASISGVIFVMSRKKGACAYY